jgi:hypothetical protein
LLLVYHICDEILGGEIESNLFRIPPHSSHICELWRTQRHQLRKS